MEQNLKQTLRGKNAVPINLKRTLTGFKPEIRFVMLPCLNGPKS